MIDLALLHLRRVAVPLPSFFTSAQRRHAATQSGAAYLISDEIADQSALEVGGWRLAVHFLSTPPVTMRPETAKVTYTSGTTGNPKGVCLPQSALDRLALSLVEAIGAENAALLAID